MLKNILKNKTLNYVMTILLVILCPVICIYLANYILRQGLVVTLRYLLPRWKIASVAYIFFFLLTVIITLLSRKVSLAYLLMGGISIIGGAAHYFKTNFRGEALFPADIVFLNAAGDMVQQFNIQLTKAMIISIIILAFFVMFSALFTLPKISDKYYINIVLAVVTLFATKGYWDNCILNTQYYKDMGFYENMYPIDIYYSNTFHTAFLFYVNSTVVPTPDGYSEKAIQDMLGSEENKHQSTPDIVFIMMESYFDPNKLFGLDFSKSINENYNSIAEKAVYGNMLSFKYGGGTADIEFNVLNQINTTQYTESLSYMNVYGSNKMPSYIHDLKTAGYRTYAMHSYTSQLYNRIKAYENMGFDGSKFNDSYINTEKYGNYISDISHVKEIIDKYEEYRSQGDKPVMIYGVSMQNHMYMSQENIDSDRVYLTSEGYSEDFIQGMGIVASYMRQTDLSLKYLYDYFENVDREVVVIVYGDHQSYNVENLSGFTSESLNEINEYSQMDNTGKYIASHTTPFIMWSNKNNLGGQYWSLVSPHYLWAIASQNFSLPSGAYEKYLYEQMEIMPVQNEYAGILCDKDGNVYSEYPEQVIDGIYMLNYDRLFGKKYSLEN